jgi:hypothetical protein
MIQSTPEILQNIASNHGESVGGIAAYIEAINHLSRIRVTLGDREIGFYFVETLDVSLQFEDVLLRTFDFKPDQLGSRIHATDDSSPRAGPTMMTVDCDSIGAAYILKLDHRQPGGVESGIESNVKQQRKNLTAHR